ASGAAVPDAVVSLQLAGSGTNAYSTKTSANGSFTVPSVSPVTYDLVVEAKGFLTAKISDLKVDSGSSRDVPAIKLDVAGVTQTVEVTAAKDTVETSNAEVSTTISKSQIQSLPVINRSPLGFLQTQKTERAAIDHRQALDLRLGNGGGDFRVRGFHSIFRLRHFDGL